MEADTSRLIGLLETAMQALVYSHAQQAVLIAQIQAGAAVAVMPSPVAAAVYPAPASLTEAPAGKTLADWLSVFEGLMAERAYKPATMKNRRSNLAHVRRLWGASIISAIRPHAISAALKEFLPQRASTARRVLGELREALSEAVANGWAETNPAMHVKMPPCKVKRARLKFEVWASMRELARSGRQRWVESMLLLALVTGQRRADLAKVRFDDVVTDETGVRCLRIEQQKEAGKGYGARVEIPLSLRLEAIDMTVGDVIEHCLASAKPGPNLLRKSGGGAIELSSLSARFHECIAAVLGEDAYDTHEWPSLHECRSLAARTYLNQGLSMAVVQVLLGHKNAEMTAIYADDRGLSSAKWKRVDIADLQPVFTAKPEMESAVIGPEPLVGGSKNCASLRNASVPCSLPERSLDVRIHTKSIKAEQIS